MTSLDIVTLIERNALTRLSKDYENKLLKKIQTNFTDHQQQLFVSSFYCFLNYDTKKDYIIDFDNIWKWLGFTRKDNAKTVLNKNFVIDIDYKVEKVFLQLKENPKGGRPSERIMLTINTFKKLCLKSNTKKADEIHDYYIKLEELLQETIDEETNELRKQLEIKDIKMHKLQRQNESLSIHVRRKIDQKTKPGKCLYILASDDIPDKMKIGSTNDSNRRIGELSIGSPSRLKVIALYYTDSYVILEEIIKKMFAKFRISLSCEWYKKEILNNIQEFIDKFINLYDEYKEFSVIDEDIINIVIENDILSHNIKTCIYCHESLSINSFYFNEDGCTFRDDCKNCYELKTQNGSKSKQCNECYKIKFAYDFDIERSSKDGLSYKCKSCKQILRKIKKEDKTETEKVLGKKQCITCNEYDYLKMFFLKNDDDCLSYFDECKKCYCEKNGESKQCFTCKKIKTVFNYNRSSNNKDGYAGNCKECLHIKRIENAEERKKIEGEEHINKKKCSLCDEHLNYIYFFKKYMNTDDLEDFEYYEECRKCFTPNSLQCNRCHEIKEVDFFGVDKTKTTGRRTICKECTNKRDRQRRIDNEKK
jgi:hypothetical protein